MFRRLMTGLKVVFALTALSVAFLGGHALVAQVLPGEGDKSCEEGICGICPDCDLCILCTGPWNNCNFHGNCQ
jgi:hypothetical protein